MRFRIKTNFLIAILVSCASVSNGYSQTDFISFGANWNYYDLGQEPPIQVSDSSTWMMSTYTDSTWNAGPAQLGYGDGDEQTTLASSTETAYFRHSFHVSDADTYSIINLHLIYDDGAVVYLNGDEIWRVNMPAGPINYNSFASSNSGDNAIANTAVSASSLVDGNNIIAIEVHQRSATSSDLSFDFEMTGQIAGQINLVRGPYLQMGREDGMIIKWRTSEPAISIVEFGIAQDSLTAISTDSTLKINHEINLSGLDVNQTYYYQIKSQQGVLVPQAADVYFNTSPPEGLAQSFRAWVLGDPGTANANARAVRDAYYTYVDSAHTDLILFLGDNAYPDGTDAEYQLAVFENMYEDKLKNSVSWSTLGNHDGRSADSETQTGPYYDIFSFPKNGESGGMASGTEAYYSFDYANVHFIILDSYDSDRSVGGPMYNWCKSDLQNTTAEWIIAFWHHPAYTKGSHDSDTETLLIQMRENFLPLLEQYGIDIVLSGHSHSYERSYFLHQHYDMSDSFDMLANTVGPNGNGNGRPGSDGAYHKSYCQDDGAVYVTAGSSGKISNGTFDHEAMFISVKELGSCVMEVDGPQINFKFLRENGTIQDSFMIVKTDCDTTSITVCSAINTSYGDVEELADSSIYQQSSDLELVRDNQNGKQTVGLVFEGLDIRRGSWIQSAHIQFMADDDAGDVSADSSYLIIQAHALDNASIFSESLLDVSARPRTINSVVWEPEPWLTPSAQTSSQATPDLSMLIQEVVNRVGYTRHSNIGFTITGIGKRSAASFDNGPGTQAPELCITYADCLETIRVDQQLTQAQTFSAENSVLANQSMPVGSPLLFTAGDKIILEPEFEIPLGREFRAQILGCKQR